MLLEESIPGALGIIIPVFGVMVLAVVAIVNRRHWTVHLETIKEKIKVVGISKIISKETFFEEDLKFWKQFKEVRTKTNIPNKKEQYSFVTIKRRIKDAGEDKFEYIFGPIVYDFSNVPAGMTTCEIPKGLYANVHIHIRNENTWKNSIEKVQKLIYEKWIPKSKYIFDKDNDIIEVEYHDKPSEKSTKTIMFYVPLKHKGI